MVDLYGCHGDSDSIDIEFQKIFVGDKLWLEGQVHFGLLQGLGIMYWPDGVTKLYEGRFDWNQLHGRGREYSKNGTLLRVGEFWDGKFVKDGWLKTDYYEGEIFDARFSGKGTRYHPNGTKQHASRPFNCFSNA